MLAGFYSIASGMLVSQRKLEVLGNNLVNSQTPGYHAQRVVASTFEEQLAMRLEDYNTGAVGDVNPIAIVETVSTQFQSGNLQDTGRNMDLAINGYGYFQVQGDAGITYLTRNGQFDVDEQGYLILPNLGRVLSSDGQLIQVGDTNFSVSEEGDVYSSEGEIVGTIRPMMPPNNEDDMVQYGNGVFGVPAGTALVDQADSTILQGRLELSNVDLTTEQTMLLEAQNSFTACSTALQIYDQLNQRAATSVASIN